MPARRMCRSWWRSTRSTSLGRSRSRQKRIWPRRGVVPEEWGGDTQFIPVSAHTGHGIDDLLDAVLLQAEVLELKRRADQSRPGRRDRIASRQRPRSGRHRAGTERYAESRAISCWPVSNTAAYVPCSMRTASTVAEAGPSIPVEILGLDGTPDAGETFVCGREREEGARSGRLSVSTRIAKTSSSVSTPASSTTCSRTWAPDEKKTLNVVLKTDVRGSLEALQAALAIWATTKSQVSWSVVGCRWYHRNRRAIWR